MLLNWLVFDVTSTVLLSIFPPSEAFRNAVDFHVSKGGLFDRNNNRPILLTPVTSKVFETVISDQLPSVLEHEGVLCNRQYGFRFCSSTNDVLTLVSRSWMASFGNNGETHLVLLNLSNTFD